MVELAELAAAHQDLVVVEVYLVGVILRSMAQILLILESLPLSKPTLLPSPDELPPNTARSTIIKPNFTIIPESPKTYVPPSLSIDLC